MNDDDLRAIVVLSIKEGHESLGIPCRIKDVPRNISGAIAERLTANLLSRGVIIDRAPRRPASGAEEPPAWFTEDE